MTNNFWTLPKRPEPSIETTGYCQEIRTNFTQEVPLHILAGSTGDWDTVWARVTYENVARRYPRILKRLGDGE